MENRGMRWKTRLDAHMALKFHSITWTPPHWDREKYLNVLYICTKARKPIQYLLWREWNHSRMCSAWRAEMEVQVMLAFLYLVECLFQLVISFQFFVQLTIFPWIIIMIGSQNLYKMDPHFNPFSEYYSWFIHSINIWRYHCS